MLKKTVTYKDFNDVEQTDDLFFNLTQTELLELQADFNGKLVEELSSVLGSGNQRLILDTFKRLVLKAYGMKTPDGRRFIKEDPDGRSIAADFTQTMAYDAFMIDLLSGGAAGAGDFVNSIMPASLVSQLPDVTETIERTQKLIEEGKLEEAQKILIGDEGRPVEVREISTYVAPEGSFSQMAQARLGAPEEPKLAKDMTREELMAALEARQNG